MNLDGYLQRLSLLHPSQLDEMTNEQLDARKKLIQSFMQALEDELEIIREVRQRKELGTTPLVIHTPFKMEE